MNNSENIIESLLERDLTFLCFQILNELDSKSLTNCRLTCQSWRNFIDYQFFSLPKGQKCIQSKLTANLLNNEFVPRTISKEHKEELFSVIADKSSISVTTTRGTVSQYDFESLEEKWNLNLSNGVVQHCMNLKYIFVVDSEFGHIFIVDRKHGILLQTIEYAHNTSIYGVRTYMNILATADYSGTLKIHHVIEEDKVTKNELTDTEWEWLEPIANSYFLPNLETFNTINDTRLNSDGFTHLENENDKLISGAENGQLDAWNFKSGDKLHTVQAAHFIQSLKVKWPFVASCGPDPNGKNVKIFNMENETHVRSIHVFSNMATDVGFISNVLVAADASMSEHIFWNWTQVLDGKKETTKIQNRKIQSEIPKDDSSAMPIIAIVGSDILVTEGRKIVKRSFWP